MTAPFKDHFSVAADGYAEARPDYPPALIERLTRGLAPSAVAWDCGCGSGQLSHGLADRVARLIATDASAAQIARARPHPRIDYRVAAAEASGLGPSSIDFVVAAQAAHWFDLPAFYQEVRRVARPGARVALVCYGLMVIEGDAAADAVNRAFQLDTVGPWWPPERALVDRGYADIDFPFAEGPPERYVMRQHWPLARVLAYVDTLSAVKQCRVATGDDPLPMLAADLAPLWGAADRPKPVSWPVFVRLGTVPSDP